MARSHVNYTFKLSIYQLLAILWFSKLLEMPTLLGCTPTDRPTPQLVLRPNLSLLSSASKGLDLAFPRFHSKVVAGSKTPSTLLLLLLCGDIQANPGPRQASTYPCGYCENHVGYNTRAIACDQCDVWYHKSCMDQCDVWYNKSHSGMSSEMFRNLENSSVSWICPKCDTPNYAGSFFHSYELDTSNSFSILAGRDSEVFQVHSPGSFFEPTSTSSPQSYSSPTSNTSRSTHPSASSKSTTSMIPDKLQNLRCLTVNCGGLKSKAPLLLTAVEYVNPDVIIGSESHLDESIKDAEVFPPGYTVYRKDRDKHGGGVFLAIKSCFTSSSLPDTETDSEIVWASIALLNRKTIIIGSYYRPPSKSKEELHSLQQSLIKLPKYADQKLIILAGDFNAPDIDWNMNAPTSGTRTSLHQELIDITLEASLTQMHLEATRGNNLLDLYFTNNPTLVKSSKSIPGISDHDMVITDSDIKPVKSTSKSRKVLHYNKADWAKAKENTALFQSQFLKDAPDRSVEDNWAFLKSHINSMINKHIPSKMCRPNRDLPWFNRPLKKAIRRKHLLYNKAKKSGSKSAWDKYKQFKKSTHSSVKRAHWDYLNNTLQEGLAKKNSKPFWRYVKAKRQDNIGIAPIKKGGKLHSSPQDKANLISDQFQSVFTQEDTSSIPAPDGIPYPAIEDLQITTEGLEKLLNKVNVNKASGPDAIPNRLLKELSHELSPILQFLFTQSLQNQTLPEDWRSANIAPLFKKGDRHQAMNYRPVSLTSVVCKLLEHVICRHILHHLETHSILTPLQHGFRSGHSCETQLIVTLQDLMKANDDKDQIDIAILDFSKAFDTVPHQRLLAKLEHYGIRGETKNWIREFLTNRTQQVIVEGESSMSVHVDSGVPQGTVLGPLLFLSHINDLPDQVASQVRLFADDCLMYRSITSEQDHLAFQEDLISLENWAEKWGMKFNANKCYIMTISRKKPSVYFYSLNNHILDHVESCKYLGVNISQDLKWETHISETTSKAKQTLGFLRRNLRKAPLKIRELAYISLVRSSLEYSATVWDPHYKKDIEAIEKVQRQAARFVCGEYSWDSSVSKMIKDLGWSDLARRRRNTRLTMLYKIANGLVAIEPNNYLIPGSSRTRSNNNQKYMQIHTSTPAYQHSFFPGTIPHWNKLSQASIDAKSVEAFKSHLD